MDAALLEKAGFGALETAAEATSGIDIRALTGQLMSGELRLDASAVVQWLDGFGASVRKGLLDALSALTAPVLASIVFKALMGDRAGEGAIGLLCRLGCVSLLMGRYLESSDVCAAALDDTLRLTNAAAPVLASALTLTGASARAAILTPSAALCAGLIEDLLRNRALPFCSIAAILAASANLSERFRLGRLFELARDIVHRGVRLMLSGFVGLMALQGLLATGTGALTMQAIRRAVQAALPIVGGEVSDSAGALVASALAVRGFAGAAGMLALLGASMAPILRLAADALALRIASAALEPLADRSLLQILGHFAALARMLLAICIGGTLLSVLMLGACLAFCAQ